MIKVCCEGCIFKLMIWVNGLKVVELDMSEIEWEDYDVEVCVELLGCRGYILLEVYNSYLCDWFGLSCWWFGLVVCWKNIFICEFEQK